MPRKSPRLRHYVQIVFRTRSSIDLWEEAITLECRALALKESGNANDPNLIGIVKAMNRVARFYKQIMHERHHAP